MYHNVLVSSLRFHFTQFPISHAIFGHARNQGNFPITLGFRITEFSLRVVLLPILCSDFSAFPATFFPLLPSPRAHVLYSYSLLVPNITTLP